MAKKEISIVDYFIQKSRGGRPQATEVATRDLATFHSIMGMLPNPDPILRKAGKSIEVYEELLYDDQVGHSVEALELAIQSMPWEIEDNGAGDDVTAQAVDMISCWDNGRIFSEIVNARLFGFQPMELLWSLDGGRWTITDMVGKPPEWFFYTDENELRLRQKGSTLKGIALPAFSFITPRNKPSFKNPYGVAALSRVFWPVAFKKGGLKFWLKFVEKYGTPFLIGKQPRGASEDATDKLLDSLENMVQDAVAVIPDDSSVDVLEAGGKAASGDLFEKMVRYHDGAIAKAIQGQTLTSSDGDGSGSFALGRVHEQTFDNVTGGLMKLIKQTYDEALRWWAQVNTGGPAPTFAWIPEEDVQKERAERDKILADTGQITFTGVYFKRRYNLEDDEFVAGGTDDTGSEGEEPPADFSEKKTPGCPCGCGGNPFLHFENHIQEQFPDQAAIDKAADDSSDRRRQLQRQGEQLTRSLVDMVSSASSYEEVLEQLSGQFPALDASEIEERLSRALFVSQVWGRIAGRIEDEDENENT